MILAFVASIALSRETQSVHLFPGAVASASGNVAYFVAGEGGVQAIDTTNGHRLWVTEDAAWPLEIAGDSVIAAKAGDGRHSFSIVSLDPETGKAMRSSSPITLPDWAVAQLNYDEGNGFRIFAENESDSQVEIRWEANLLEIPGRQLNPALQSHSGRHAAGAFTFEVGTSQVSEISTPTQKPSPPFPVYSGQDPTAQGSLILWKPREMGDLTIFLSQQAAGHQMPPLELKVSAIAVRTATNARVWSVPLGLRRIPRRRM